MDFTKLLYIWHCARFFELHFEVIFFWLRTGKGVILRSFDKEGARPVGPVCVQPISFMLIPFEKRLDF